VIGIGDQKRISIDEILLQQLSIPEIKAVLAHEFGHAKLHRILSS